MPRLPTNIEPACWRRVRNLPCREILIQPASEKWPHAMIRLHVSGRTGKAWEVTLPAEELIAAAKRAAGMED